MVDQHLNIDKKIEMGLRKYSMVSFIILKLLINFIKFLIFLITINLLIKKFLVKIRY